MAAGRENCGSNPSAGCSSCCPASACRWATTRSNGAHQSGENEERIIEIEIERLRPFKEHPFQVKDDKEMFLLQESIEKYGILNPLIVRPVPDGYYEIISGHRRKHAAEKLGYRKVPVP